VPLERTSRSHTLRSAQGLPLVALPLWRLRFAPRHSCDFTSVRSLARVAADVGPKGNVHYHQWFPERIGDAHQHHLYVEGPCGPPPSAAHRGLHPAGRQGAAESGHPGPAR